MINQNENFNLETILEEMKSIGTELLRKHYLKNGALNHILDALLNKIELQSFGARLGSPQKNINKCMILNTNMLLKQ